MILINEGKKKFWHPTEITKAGPSRENVNNLLGVYTNNQVCQNSAQSLIEIIHVLYRIFIGHLLVLEEPSIKKLFMKKKPVKKAQSFKDIMSGASLAKHFQERSSSTRDSVCLSVCLLVGLWGTQVKVYNLLYFIKSHALHYYALSRFEHCCSI